NSGRNAIDVMFGTRFDQGKWVSRFTRSDDGLFLGYHREEQSYELQPHAFDDPTETWRVNGVRPSELFAGRLKSRIFKALVFLEHDDHPAPHLWFGADPNALEQAIVAETGEPTAHDQFDTLIYRVELHAPLDKIKQLLPQIDQL